MRTSAIRRMMGLAMVLGLAQAALANPAAPGAPPSRNGWEYDLEGADRLFDQGYLKDAQGKTPAAPDAASSNPLGRLPSLLEIPTPAR